VGKPLQIGSSGKPTATAQPYVLNVLKPGRPNSAEVLLRILATVDFTLPINLTGSRATSEVAANASATFTIKKNGASIGTFNFAAAASTATFTFAAAVSFTAGTDILTVEAPNPRDVNLSDVTFALLGTRN
jgi:hypothetical protein